MHLYAIRQPEMDAVFHLHPGLAASGDFRISLPAMPPGTYKLYADVVHANGFPETLVTTITIPAGHAMAAPLAPTTRSALPAAHRRRPTRQHLQASRRLHHGLGSRPPAITANAAYSLPLPSARSQRQTAQRTCSPTWEWPATPPSSRPTAPSSPTPIRTAPPPWLLMPRQSALEA